MPEYPLTQSELRGANVYWCLTVTWAGREHRWATDPVDITDDDGNVIPFRHTMSSSFELALELFKLTPRSGVSFDGLMFDGDVNVPELIQRGYRLERAPAELAIWINGRTWEQRRVMLLGRVTLPDYGAQGEPVAFTLEPDDADDRALIPAQTINPLTRHFRPPVGRVPLSRVWGSIVGDAWPNAGESAQGKIYPLVFGRPYAALGGTLRSQVTAGSPAYYVASSEVLIAGHHVVASTVSIVNVTQGAYLAGCAVSNTQDGLGRDCATADITVGGIPWAPVITPSAEDEYATVWIGGGGMISRRRADRVMQGAGEILEYLLEQSTIRVDRGRFASVFTELDQYVLAGCVNEQVSPWAYAIAHVLPLLPISLLPGPEGLYPVLWDPEPRAVDAVAELHAGEGLYREGRVEIDRKPIANHMTIAYAPSGSDGDPRARRVATGRDIEAWDPSMWSAQHLRASRLIYGHLEAEPLESRVIYDETTADRVLAWRSRHSAFASRSVTYANPSADWAWLDPGDVVTLTDADLYFSDQIALVTAIRWADTMPSITLTIIESPDVDVRALRTGGIGSEYVDSVISRSAPAAAMYGSGGSVAAGSWAAFEMDVERYSDAGSWTVDTANHYIQQDTDGPVVLIGLPTAYSSAGGYGYKGRLEVDSGGGWAAITGTESRAWVDQLTSASYGGTANMLACVDGASGDKYRVATREDAASSFTGCTDAGNFLGFISPGATCWAAGGSDLTTSAAYQDVHLAEQVTESGYTVASDEITITAAGDYLVIYTVRITPGTTNAREGFARLVSDTGSGYAAIAGTTIGTYNGNRAGYGNSMMGHMIYTATAGEKIKLQYQGEDTNDAVTGEGSGVLLVKLPSGYQGYSGYTSSDAGNYGGAAAKVAINEDRITEGMSNSSGEITLPASSTVCLVLGSFPSYDTYQYAISRAYLYLDSGGGFAAITGAAGHNQGNDSAVSSVVNTHATVALVDDFAASDKIALYGSISGTTGSATTTPSQLTILRLDNL